MAESSDQANMPWPYAVIIIIGMAMIIGPGFVRQEGQDNTLIIFGGLALCGVAFITMIVRSSRNKPPDGD